MPKHLQLGIVLLSVTLLAPMAHAATLGDMFPPGAASCYESVGGTKPSVVKKVDKLWLFASLEHIKQDKPGDLIMLGLNVRLRNAKRMESVGLICFKQADETWRCNEHTCNGRAVLLNAAGSDKLTLDLQGGLTLHGACGSQDAKKRTQLELPRFDQKFTLKRTSSGACPRQ